jgi:O-antigen/teichoic acid export membrane protein
VYANSELPIVVTVLGATAIVAGFESTKIASAGRVLALGRVTTIEIISQAAAVAMMIAFAFYSTTIWSLVFGSWVGAMIKATLSHAVLPGVRNNFCWNQENLKRIRTFGRWILLSSLFGFLATNLDRILVAGYLSIREFALFSIATLLIGAAQDIISRLLSSIAFPAFAEVVRQRPNNLCIVYYKFRTPIDVFCLFTCGFLFFAGEVVVRVLYDTRYHDAGYILGLLSLSLFVLRYSGLGACCIANGEPRVVAILTACRLAGVAALLPIAHWVWGDAGVLIAIPVTYFVTFPLIFYFSWRLRLLNLRKELQVLPILLLGGGMGWILSSVIANSSFVSTP